jgi:hypothetical protein
MRVDLVRFMQRRLRDYGVRHTKVKRFDGPVIVLQSNSRTNDGAVLEVDSPLWDDVAAYVPIEHLNANDGGLDNFDAEYLNEIMKILLYKEVDKYGAFFEEFDREHVCLWLAVKLCVGALPFTSAMSVVDESPFGPDDSAWILDKLIDFCGGFPHEEGECEEAGEDAGEEAGEEPLRIDPACVPFLKQLRRDHGAVKRARAEL